MSITYYVYSPNKQVVTRSRMVHQLQSKGWMAVFVETHDDMHILPDGPIAYDLLLAANSQETANSINDMIRRGDKEALDGLYERNRVASCTVAVTQPYDFNTDHSESDARELSDAIGDKAVDAMRSAISFYEIDTSAHRSMPSYQFQTDVWEALGELAGGLMEDPQSGSYQLCENGVRREIEAPGAPEEPDPSDMQSLLTRFMERAREHGFPVRGQGVKTELVTDELALERMEQLLRLADECVPPNEGFSLGDILLEEYVSKKDESFEAERRDWIEAMKNRRTSDAADKPGARSLLSALWKGLFGGPKKAK